MMRKIVMTALVAGSLALGGCDWCGCEGEGASAGDGGAPADAVVQAGGEDCGECLGGACDEAGGAADATLACPVSGNQGGECAQQDVCSGDAQCDDAPCGKEPCEEKTQCCPGQCEEPCDAPTGSPE